MNAIAPPDHYPAGHAGTHIPLPVVHADAHLLVLDKPAGLLSVPGRGADKQDCLSARVQQVYPESLVVHRLDMATSGLMLMARDASVQRDLSRAFAARQVHKQYTAVVHGLAVPPPAADGWGLIDLPILADWPRRPLRVIDAECGKPSCTRWKVLGHDAASGTTRLLLEPVTGRSHQLRVHLQALGHPIVGDALYGPAATAGAGAPSPISARSARSTTAISAVSANPRLLLHASALAFSHPGTGQTLAFASAPPF